MPRYSIKPGRGPSSFNAVGSVFAAIFGVLWTLGAIAMASSAPFPFGIVFPLFGVVFVALAIAGAVYHAHNASQPNRFSNEIAAESVIQVVAGGDAHGTLFVDRLNSHGIFSVVLSVTRNAPSVDGSHSFTTLVQLRTPRGGGAGGPCTYTFKDERLLDDVLAVSAVPATVPLGMPHAIGILDGQPITLLVRHPDQRSDGG